MAPDRGEGGWAKARRASASDIGGRVGGRGGRTLPATNAPQNQPLNEMADLEIGQFKATDGYVNKSMI